MSLISGNIILLALIIDESNPFCNFKSRLPQMAKRLEEHLYRTARTKEEYLDARTLKSRLQNVAQGLEASRSSSVAGQSAPTNQVPSVQVDVGLSEAERRTKSLQQQLQQMQQLQKLQQQGAAEDYLSQQAKLLQMRQAGLGSAPQLPLGHTRDNLRAGMPGRAPAVQAQGNAPPTIGSPGIVKTSGTKYQDPAEAQKRKVVKQQQQRLLLLRHASKCNDGVACKTKFCGPMVALWKHMKKCRDKNCKTAHCLSSRCVLNHYRKCKIENKTSTCEVCAPVMQQIKMQQNQTECGVIHNDDSQVDSTSKISPADPSESQIRKSSDTVSQQKQRQLEEIAETQQKIQQQQLLLKQLRQQQVHLLEQQQQLRQQQEQVQPQTQQGMQLQQQQGLLLQLQQLFQQQQLVLQQEVARKSHSAGENDATASSVQLSELVSTDAVTELPKEAMCKGRQSGQGRGEAAKWRGGKGKSLSAMEPTSSELGNNASKSARTPQELASRKRPAHDITEESKLEGAEETRSTKTLKVEENLVPQSKVLQQGDTENTTSLIQSMPVAAVERHLASLNDKIQINSETILRRCLPVIRKLIGDQFGWVFRDPVDPVVLGLPDYFDVVRHPMNLGLVEMKLQKGEYTDMDSFARDTRLVFENAILYNGEDSEVGEVAAVMLRHFEMDFKAVLKGESSTAVIFWVLGCVI